MKRRSLVVFAGDPSEDSGSVLLDICFCFGPSGSADIVLSFMKGNVMAFLNMSRLPWSSHLSGELF